MATIPDAAVQGMLHFLGCDATTFTPVKERESVLVERAGTALKASAIAFATQLDAGVVGTGAKYAATVPFAVPGGLAIGAARSDKTAMRDNFYCAYTPGGATYGAPLSTHAAFVSRHYQFHLAAQDMFEHLPATKRLLLFLDHAQQDDDGRAEFERPVRDTAARMVGARDGAAEPTEARLLQRLMYHCSRMYVQRRLCGGDTGWNRAHEGALPNAPGRSWWTRICCGSADDACTEEESCERLVREMMADMQDRFPVLWPPLQSAMLACGADVGSGSVLAHVDSTVVHFGVCSLLMCVAYLVPLAQVAYVAATQFNALTFQDGIVATVGVGTCASEVWQARARVRRKPTSQAIMAELTHVERILTLVCWVQTVVAQSRSLADRTGHTALGELLDQTWGEISVGLLVQRLWMLSVVVYALYCKGLVARRHGVKALAPSLWGDVCWITRRFAPYLGISLLGCIATVVEHQYGYGMVAYTQEEQAALLRSIAVDKVRSDDFGSMFPAVELGQAWALLMLRVTTSLVQERQTGLLSSTCRLVGVDFTAYYMKSLVGADGIGNIIARAAAGVPGEGNLKPAELVTFAANAAKYPYVGTLLAAIAGGDNLQAVVVDGDNTKRRAVEGLLKTVATGSTTAEKEAAKLAEGGLRLLLQAMSAYLSDDTHGAMRAAAWKRMGVHPSTVELLQAPKTNAYLADVLFSTKNFQAIRAAAGKADIGQIGWGQYWWRSLNGLPT